jgi:hypothetical protein
MLGVRPDLVVTSARYAAPVATEQCAHPRRSKVQAIEPVCVSQEAQWLAFENYR